MTSTKTNMSSNDDPNVTPPMMQAIPLGMQHVLAMFASNVTPSIIVAGAAGLAFGGTEQIYLIQMAMLFAGVATLFQTIGVGPVGARLPIMQGTSFAFVGVLAGLAATQGLGVALTACLVGGVLHFILVFFKKNCAFFSPPGNGLGGFGGWVYINSLLRFNTLPGGRVNFKKSAPLWLYDALGCRVNCDNRVYRV